MTQEQLDALQSKIDGYKAQVETKADATAIDALKAELQTLKDNNVDKSVIDTYKEQIDELALQLKGITEKGNATVKTLEEQLAENKEALKEIANGSNKEVVVKALTNRAAIANNEQAFDLPDLGQLAHRKLTA